MRNPCQAFFLAVLMASLILPPALPVAGATRCEVASSDRGHRILLVGDSLSIGLGKQLETTFANRPGVTFAHLGKVSSGLANPAFFDWDANLTSQVKTHHPDVVLIMLGANDNKRLPVTAGHSTAFGSSEWDAAYASRLTRLHTIIRSEDPSAKVYFIGVPVMGDAAFNAEMVHVNGVLAKTAKSLPGTSFIDVKDVLADPSGAFAPVARMPDGDVVKLRAEDGVHISGTGSKLLAARCIEAIADTAGLAKGELVASLDNAGVQPLTASAAAQAPVRVAERRAASPAAKPVAAAPATPAPATTVTAAPTVAAAVVTKPAAPAATAAAASGVYAVADGDTVWSVAKRLGVTPEQLTDANPGIDPRRMSIGQQLTVPAGSPAQPAVAQAPAKAQPAASAPSAARVHAVADGDNFWSVARQYGVTISSLTQANPGVDPTRLRIGQSLVIPGPGHSRLAESGEAGRPAVPAIGSNGYVVADGDNLWLIAHRLGVDVAVLKRLNVAVDPQRLQPGQVLALPDEARAEGGQAPTRQDARIVSDSGLYPVAKGDTMWSLSRRFGVGLEDLLAVNGELEPSRLRVGQLVTIPTVQPVASGDALHFPVSAGDSLWSIARRFDVTIEALVAANPGVDPLRLREGQMLRVPSSLAAVAAANGKTDTAGQPQALATPAAVPAKDASTPATAVPTSDAPRQHTVSVGDTLWDLSRRYGVSVKRILAENTGLDPVRLHVGQTVRLPGSVSMAAR